MKHILLIGWDHKQSPLAIREQLAIPWNLIREAAKCTFGSRTPEEIVLLSTCNRFELYICTEDAADALCMMQLFFRKEFLCISMPDRERSSAASETIHIVPDYVLTNEAAVKHLFRVASGLESLILGEHQILAQLKIAMAQAVHDKTIGPLLSRLFQMALHCGKKVRHRTQISKGAMSTGAAAVQLIGKRIGTWRGKKALVVGAGKAGQMCVKSLLGLKECPEITVLNQSRENLQEVSHLDRTNSLKLNMEFERIHALSANSDAVFVTTAASTPVLRESELRSFERLPSFMVDLSVPRNIEPSIANLPAIKLYSMDELTSEVDINLATRANLVRKAEEIIDEVIQTKWTRNRATDTSNPICLPSPLENQACS